MLAMVILYFHCQKNKYQNFKTSFGYKAFYLKKINKKAIMQFSEVKDQIKADLKEKVNEKLYSSANIFMKIYPN